MSAIRKNKGKEREEGQRSPGEFSELLRRGAPNGHRIDLFDDSALMENIHLINAYYDKNLPGDVREGGPIKSLVKRAARKLIGWYLAPSLDNQRLFNAYATRSMNEMKRYLDHLQINEDILSTIMRRDLELFRANLLFLNRYLERRTLEIEEEIRRLREFPRWEAEGELRPANASGTGDLTSSLDVLTLEQRLHGSPRLVRDRQRVFLPYFRGCKEVLAIGCGRGELLQLLHEEGIMARGTETKPALVDYCRDSGLDVALADPLEFLEEQPDSSLDGIVLSRFAGHQPPGRLARMLTLCRRKLKRGAPLVIETPNPFSLYAVASYLPLHPETLKLLCLSYGFVEPEVIFLNPLPPEEHLEDLEVSASSPFLDPRSAELFRTASANFEKINRTLFSHRDYALVTRNGNAGAD